MHGIDRQWERWQTIHKKHTFQSNIIYVYEALSVFTSISWANLTKWLDISACNVSGTIVPEGSTFLDTVDTCSVCSCSQGVTTCNSDACGKLIYSIKHIYLNRVILCEHGIVTVKHVSYEGKTNINLYTTLVIVNMTYIVSWQCWVDITIIITCPTCVFFYYVFIINSLLTVCFQPQALPTHVSKHICKTTKD